MPYYGPIVQPRMGDYTAAAGAAVSDNIQKQLERYHDLQKQQAFSDATMEHLAQTMKPDGTPYVPIDALNRYHEANATQKSGMAQAALASATFDAARQQQAGQMALEQQRVGLERRRLGIQQESLGFIPTEEDKAAAWAGGYTLMPTGHGRYKAVPMGGDADKLQLTEEEKAGYAAAGVVPVRTTAKSFQAVPMPEAAAPPDTDAQGNPIYSPDGTMYRSKGQFKPITGPMMQAKMFYDAMHPKAQEQAKSQPGFSIFSPSTWFGQKTPSQPPANGTGTSTAGAQQQYPVGTRARKGDQWFVMTASGWKPEQ